MMAGKFPGKKAAPPAMSMDPEEMGESGAVEAAEQEPAMAGKKPKASPKKVPAPMKSIDALRKLSKKKYG